MTYYQRRYQSEVLCVGSVTITRKQNFDLRFFIGIIPERDVKYFKKNLVINGKNERYVLSFHNVAKENFAVLGESTGLRNKLET